MTSKNTPKNINATTKACDLHLKTKTTKPKPTAPNVIDVDQYDCNKPECVSEYVVSIFKNYKKSEMGACVRPNYIELQNEITPTMRAILIDWLVMVQQKFELMSETLFLAVNLIDRFLEKEMVERRKLQLVGVTCMLIACKYEEIIFPEIRDFIYITDNAYRRRQIILMEIKVLNVLEFRLMLPTPTRFVRRFIKAANQNSPKFEHIANYITERMLQEYDMLQFPPSIIAASAVSMALSVLQMPVWNDTLSHYTGYKYNPLKKCIQKMTEIFSNQSSLKAVEKKYASSKYKRVSNDVKRYFLASEI